MMKTHNYIPVLLLVIILFGVSCQEKKPEKTIVKKQFSTEKKALNSIANDTSLVEKVSTPDIYNISTVLFKEYNMQLGMSGVEQVDEIITAAGYIEVPNENKAELRSYIGGYLQSSPLLPGDYVKKGQFLVSLNNLEYIQLQREYLQAKEELTYLETVYERNKLLAEENITSIKNRQLAESEYNSALANVESLKKKLELININVNQLQATNISSSINLYAPMSGYITMVNVVNGQFAEPTDVIFEIINTDHLHIALKVYEKDILKIKKGQKIKFRVPEACMETFNGEVFLVGKTIDNSDRTVTVHCHIADDSKLPVVVGMYTEAEIYVTSKETFCVPVTAIIREDRQYFVFVNTSANSEEYVFEKAQVEVGQINESCAEIIGSSKQKIEGKQILVDGAFNL